MSKSRVHRQMYANDLSVLNPTLWANEAITRLLPGMVLGNLINRDFDNIPTKFGDLVNIFIPGNFSFVRKGALCENVTIQDITGAAIQVPMDQWPMVAFLICDGEEDRGFLDLVATYLQPAVETLAEGIDRIVSNQVYQFMHNFSGRLNLVTENNIVSFLLEAREKLNVGNVPLRGRTMILTPGTETAGLKVEAFTDADRSGSNFAQLEGALGRKYGWDLLMSQTQPEIADDQVKQTAAVNFAAGYGAGATSIVVDTAVPVGGLQAGVWVRIAGDDTPQQVIASNVAAGVGTITLAAPGLKRAVLDNAVIVAVAPGTVNNVAGYPGTTSAPRVIGYAKQILVTGFTGNAPKLGQLVTFGIQSTIYSIIRVDVINAGAGQYGIWLDKPLVTALTNGLSVNLGPSGKYNFGFLRNAFTLVNRPLPRPRVGVLSSIRAFNNLSLRITISYDAEKQGHLVVIDTLMGVGVVDSDLGIPMYG
jgi:hypothetical protein